MSGCIVVLNAGSSSIKFAVYEGRSPPQLLYHGQLQQIAAAQRLRVTDSAHAVVAEQTWQTDAMDHQAATHEILNTLNTLLAGKPVGGVGHRVVHGGTRFAAPIRVDESVLQALADLIPLAPLHQPQNLEPIRAIAAAAPNLAQVACFDTAFHRMQPELTQLFALPRRFTEAGVRRYGFHGLSYEYIVSRLPKLSDDLARGRVVIGHLGSGASLCAVSGGKSVATTMGLTPVDGLVMGTRCGAIDPGALLYLMNHYGMAAKGVEDLIYRQSGLLGVSGISSDMRTLRASGDLSAKEAIALFVYRIVREIGSLAAALGGLDGLVFTGGIGENDAETRAEVAAGCRWLGLDLDHERNAAGLGRISSDASKLAAWAIATDEERMIAEHTMAVLGQP